MILLWTLCICILITSVYHICFDHTSATTVQVALHLNLPGSTSSSSSSDTEPNSNPDDDNEIESDSTRQNQQQEDTDPEQTEDEQTNMTSTSTSTDTTTTTTPTLTVMSDMLEFLESISSGRSTRMDVPQFQSLVELGKYYDHTYTFLQHLDDNLVRLTWEKYSDADLNLCESYSITHRVGGSSVRAIAT